MVLESLFVPSIPIDAVMLRFVQHDRVEASFPVLIRVRLGVISPLLYQRRGFACAHLHTDNTRSADLG